MMINISTDFFVLMGWLVLCATCGNSRVANRISNSPGSRDYYNGFRLALVRR